jgi:hypothetical protein
MYRFFKGVIVRHLLQGVSGVQLGVRCTVPCLTSFGPKMNQMLTTWL